MNTIDVIKHVIPTLDAIEAKLDASNSAIAIRDDINSLRAMLDVEAQAAIEATLAQTPLTCDELAEALRTNRNIIVHFTKNAFFEDDWTEEGSLARITNVRWKGNADCFEFTIDASGFESHNFPLMTSCYYENVYSMRKVCEGLIEQKDLYTAIEAGMYKSVFTTFFSAYADGKEYTPDNSPDTVYQHLANTLINEIGTFYAVIK
jgi:hypothetical protein